MFLKDGISTKRWNFTILYNTLKSLCWSPWVLPLVTPVFPALSNLLQVVLSDTCLRDPHATLLHTQGRCISVQRSPCISCLWAFAPAPALVITPSLPCKYEKTCGGDGDSTMAAVVPWSIHVTKCIKSHTLDVYGLLKANYSPIKVKQTNKKTLFVQCKTQLGHET